MTEAQALGKDRRKPSLDHRGKVGWDRGGEVGGWRRGLVEARLSSWLWRGRIRSSLFARRE